MLLVLVSLLTHSHSFFEFVMKVAFTNNKQLSPFQNKIPCVTAAHCTSNLGGIVVKVSLPDAVGLKPIWVSLRKFVKTLKGYHVRITNYQTVKILTQQNNYSYIKIIKKCTETKIHMLCKCHCIDQKEPD